MNRDWDVCVDVDLDVDVDVVVDVGWSYIGHAFQIRSLPVEGSSSQHLCAGPTSQQRIEGTNFCSFNAMFVPFIKYITLN